MKGHENETKIPHSNHSSWPWGENGGRLERKKCMPCVVARIYIVGSLVVLERGVRVRRNCNIFNLAMENVLKGLPDKISCQDIIHKSQYIEKNLYKICLLYNIQILYR